MKINESIKNEEFKNRHLLTCFHLDTIRRQLKSILISITQVKKLPTNMVEKEICYKKMTALFICIFS